MKESESVADHIFGTAFICMVLAPKYGLDQAKLVKMALVHDIAEGLTGDIVLEKGTMPVTPKELKHEKEELALKQFFKDLPEEHEYHEL